MTFIGGSKIVVANFEEEIGVLWRAMFPKIDPNTPNETSEEKLWSSESKKWRNAWCDVHTIWTHINARRDVFVRSNTADFQNNLGVLKALGLRSALTPEKAIALVGNERFKPGDANCQSGF